MAASAGKYYSSVKAGRVQIGSTAAAGTAFPISTGTAVTFALWNSNPDYYAVPLWFSAGFTSGTIALGEFGFANQNVGFNIATGAAMTAFNSGTPKNALLGGGSASVMSFSPAATTTLATGGTACFWLGISNQSASATGGQWTCYHDFDGRIIVPPGQIFFLCGSVAQTALYTCSLAWEEVPITSA